MYALYIGNDKNEAGGHTWRAMRARIVSNHKSLIQLAGYDDDIQRLYAVSGPAHWQSTDRACARVVVLLARRSRAVGRSLAWYPARLCGR